MAHGKYTHVIQLDSFHAIMGPQLKAKHIAEDVNFHELVLKERSGRARHTFISQCKIERVHSFFKECKE